MRSITAVLAAFLVALGSPLALAGCGGEDEAAPTTETETQTAPAPPPPLPPPPPPPPPAAVVRVTVEDGLPQGGIVRETVAKGDRVVLVVRSDVADEVHLHGYDISRDVAAGGTARLPFKATIPGRFEVELEERGVQIADLTVQP